MAVPLRMNDQNVVHAFSIACLLVSTFWSSLAQASQWISCDDVKQYNGQYYSAGIYTIHWDGKAVPVYCDENGWTLVFKLSAGLAYPLNENNIKFNGATMWSATNGNATWWNEMTTAAMNITTSTHFYKSRIALDYNSITQYSVRIYSGATSSAAKSITFQRTPSNDATTWFDYYNMISSNWTDIQPRDQGGSLFSLPIPGTSRSFFVNDLYGANGCAGDKGWLLVGNGDAGSDVCKDQYFPSSRTGVQIIYSPAKTAGIWSISKSYATRFAVFVKTNKLSPVTTNARTTSVASVVYTSGRVAPFQETTYSNVRPVTTHAPLNPPVTTASIQAVSSTRAVYPVTSGFEQSGTDQSGADQSGTDQSGTDQSGSDFDNSGENQSTEPADQNRYAIIGGAIGAAGLVLIAAVVGAVVFIRHRRKRQDRPDDLVLMNMAKSGAPAQSPLKILSNVKVLNKLGGGQFGEVFLGEWNGATKVALKKLKDEAFRDFMREASIIANLNHPNVIRCLGLYCSEDNQRYIVMEYVREGSLDVIIAQDRHLIKVPDLIRMATQAASGLLYLEEMKILHRDLSLRNLLVAKDGNEYIIKVGDFGLSRSVRDGLYETQNSLFAVKWAALECIFSGQFTGASDVWAFGIVLWELFSYGETPYPGMSNREVVDEIKSGYRMPSPKGCPQAVYQLMQDTWKVDPAARPSFKEIHSRLSAMLSQNITPAPLPRPVRVPSTINNVPSTFYNVARPAQAATTDPAYNGFYNTKS